jgi:hypothetical protein
MWLGAERRNEPIGELAPERGLEPAESRHSLHASTARLGECVHVGEKALRGFGGGLDEYGGTHVTHIDDPSPRSNPWRE